MYQKVECVMLECDRCKDHFQDPHTDFSIYTDESAIGEHAQENDWYMFGEDGKHYCPKCYTVDDEDNITIKPPINQP